MTTAPVRTRVQLRRRRGSNAFAVVKRAVKHARADNIGDVAAALAYYSFTTLPATLLTSLGVFALLAGRDSVHTLAQKLGEVAPAQSVSLVEQSLDRALQNRNGAVVMVVVGGALAAWTATGAMNALMRGLNLVYGCRETRGFLKQRLVALGMVACAVVAFSLILGLLVLGPHLSHWIGQTLGAETLVSWVWWIAEWPLLIGGLLLAGTGALYLGPNVDGHRYRFLTLGSAVAVGLWLVASALFAVYVSAFGSYNKAWGSLSAVIVTLVWLWIGGLSILFGAEVDAVAEHEERS